MDIYQSLIKENKGDGEIFYYMGKIEQNNSKPDKANEYFINVLESNDKIFYNDALKELIKNLKTQKKYLDAINIFYKYGLKDNMDPRGAEELNILLADIYFNMDDFNNSSSEYRRFMSRYPDSKDYVKALFYLAYSLEKLAVDPDFDEAYRIYKIIVNNYPESKYSDMSKKRILHLERHYLKIN